MPDGVPGWVAFVVFVALVPIVPVVELRARRWGRLAPVVLLGAVVGVYVCVPDTEFVRPLLGALGGGRVPGAARLAPTPTWRAWAGAWSRGSRCGPAPSARSSGPAR